MIKHLIVDQVDEGLSPFLCAKNEPVYKLAKVTNPSS